MTLLVLTLYCKWLYIGNYWNSGVYLLWSRIYHPNCRVNCSFEI